ncbi:MAG TPA: STAS domain-containing protein [Solirubrobacteraceae bacterium]|nr:STAS domain-containing protein [Solirubrobacteraceae bacterium]
MHEREARSEPAGIDARGIRPPAAYAIAEGGSSGGVTVLVLTGELDLAAAPVLRARVDAAAGGRGLVVDLEQTTFVDSAVLKELLRARAELAAADAGLVLAGVSTPVRRLLDLTRTYELFEHVPDADAGVRLLGGG